MDVGDQDAAGAEVVQLVHEPLGPARGTIARTATQPSRCSGETVGHSMPGVSATAFSTWSRRDVVVHHHVAAGDQDALEPAQEHLEAGRAPRRRG